MEKMEEQVRRYFQGMLDDSERLELLRKMDTDPRLKSEFIGQQNIEALSLLWKQKQDEREAGRNYSQLIRRMMRISIFLLFVCTLQPAAIETEAQHAMVTTNSHTVSIKQLIDYSGRIR